MIIPLYIKPYSAGHDVSVFSLDQKDGYRLVDAEIARVMRDREQMEGRHRALPSIRITLFETQIEARAAARGASHLAPHNPVGGTAPAHVEATALPGGQAALLTVDYASSGLHLGGSEILTIDDAREDEWSSPVVGTWSLAPEAAIEQLRDAEVSGIYALDGRKPIAVAKVLGEEFRNDAFGLQQLQKALEFAPGASVSFCSRTVADIPNAIVASAQTDAYMDGLDPDARQHLLQSVARGLDGSSIPRIVDEAIDRRVHAFARNHAREDLAP